MEGGFLMWFPCFQCKTKCHLDDMFADNRWNYLCGGCFHKLNFMKRQLDNIRDLEQQRAMDDLYNESFLPEREQ